MDLGETSLAGITTETSATTVHKKKTREGKGKKKFRTVEVEFKRKETSDVSIKAKEKSVYQDDPADFPELKSPIKNISDKTATHQAKNQAEKEISDCINAKGDEEKIPQEDKTVQPSGEIRKNSLEIRVFQNGVRSVSLPVLFKETRGSNEEEEELDYDEGDGETPGAEVIRENIVTEVVVDSTKRVPSTDICKTPVTPVAKSTPPNAQIILPPCAKIAPPSTDRPQQDSGFRGRGKITKRGRGGYWNRNRTTAPDHGYQHERGGAVNRGRGRGTYPKVFYSSTFTEAQQQEHFSQNRSVQQQGHSFDYENNDYEEPLPYKRGGGWAINRSKRRPCAFCGDDEHPSHVCPKFPTLQQRWEIVRLKKLCRFCLYPGHPEKACKANGHCYSCHLAKLPARTHHRALCGLDRLNQN